MTKPTTHYTLNNKVRLIDTRYLVSSKQLVGRFARWETKSQKKKEKNTSLPTYQHSIQTVPGYTAVGAINNTATPLKISNVYI